MSVDFPRPDSPGDTSLIRTRGTCNELLRTNDHGGELEALADALPVDLVGEVGEANEAHELFPDDGGEALLVSRSLLLLERGRRASAGGDGEGRVAVGGAVVGHGWEVENERRRGRERKRDGGRRGRRRAVRYLDGREEWNGGKN